jgi:hypothetical protein
MERHSAYKDTLLNAFPRTLKSEVETVLSILPFDNNFVKRAEEPIIKIDNLIFPSNLTIQLDNELIFIPYRIYFNEPDIEKENKLTDIQKTILNCIYLRHFDGYVRQKRLEKLVDKNEKWIIPFTIQLLGEYVFELLEVLEKHINNDTIYNYIKLIKENPKYWKQTQSRMTTFWDKDYRRQYPNLKTYLGRMLVNRIKKSERITAC